VPVAVHALGGDDIEELGITNFSDYVMQLPSVTAGGSGPGQNTIYIRGIASTTPNLTTAGVAGLAPNVAFYLDDQPLASRRTSRFTSMTSRWRNPAETSTFTPLICSASKCCPGPRARCSAPVRRRAMFD
jgi:hypothetical protein